MNETVRLTWVHLHNCSDFSPTMPTTRALIAAIYEGMSGILAIGIFLTFKAYGRDKAPHRDST